MDHNQGKYQEELLDLYKRIDVALTRKEINFFAAYGTCIGAMREKGIISWDEDVDIAVFSSDLSNAIAAINESGLDMFASQVNPILIKNGRVFNKISRESSIERRRAYVDIYVLENADDLKPIFLLRALIYSGLERIIERRNGKIKNGSSIRHAIADIVALPFRCFKTSALLRIKHWVYSSSHGKKYYKIPGDGKFRFPACAFESSFRAPFMDIGERLHLRINDLVIHLLVSMVHGM